MLITLIVVLIAALGHTVLWVSADNRLHGTGLRRPVVKALSALLRLAFFLLPAVFAWHEFHGATGWHVPDARADFAWAWQAYGMVCLAVAALVPWHIARRLIAQSGRALVSNHVVRLHPSEREWAGPGRLNRFLVNLPANQCLRLEENEKNLELPRLRQALDGLSIAHLSDLHFTGRIAREFFDNAVDATNGMQADLIAITGDLVDKDRCIDWIPGTLGRLRAPLGVYYVLGNHDLRVDLKRLQQTLSSAGIIALGGRTRLVNFRDQAIVLTGCELPWHRPRAGQNQETNVVGGSDALRILLAHTPDRFRWARRQGFDLLLAGHTHGGQIQLPWIGPVVAPSLYGVRFASGVFQSGNTVMHVSRGASGLHPLRWNCSPEITKLILRAPA